MTSIQKLANRKKTLKHAIIEIIPYDQRGNHAFKRITRSTFFIGGYFQMELTIYLAGEIHNNWRDEIKEKAKALQLPVTFVGPMEDHDRSDNIGEEILGKQPDPILKDEAASKINNLRTQILMKKADVVIAYFGEKYKQWNTAMDASTAVALNKPLILIRPASLHHPLKELSNKANVTVETINQALKVLSYIFE
jgi:YtoQ family protein